MRYSATSVAAAAVLLSSALSVSASDAVLRGFARTCVIVETLDKDAAAASLSVDRLQTAAELRLRRAGLKVVSCDAPGTLQMPKVYINVHLFPRTHSAASATTSPSASLRLSSLTNVAASN
jgi:hypothetical protein